MVTGWNIECLWCDCRQRQALLLLTELSKPSFGAHPALYSTGTEDYLQGGEENGVKIDIKYEFDIQRTQHHDIFL